MSWQKELPMESGYYWCDRWGQIGVPFLCYVKADDPDAGTRKAHLMDGRWVELDHVNFRQSRWWGPVKVPEL